MSNASVRTLIIRPFQASDLSFGRNGVISIRNPNLAIIGKSVNAFDFANYVSQLGTVDASGRHIFDSSRIHQDLKNVCLYGLHNLELQSELDIAISKRQTMYLQRYKHIPSIAQIWNSLYPLRVHKIAQLEQSNSARFTALTTAFGQDATPQVTRPIARTRHFGELSTTNEQLPLGNRQITDAVTYSSTIQGQQTGGPSNLQGQSTKQATRNEVSVLVKPAWYDSVQNKWIPLDVAPGDNAPPYVKDGMVTVARSKTNYGQPAQSQYWQETQTENDLYKAPYEDAQTEFLRAEIALLEERFLHELQSVHINDLPAMLACELQQLDLEVSRLQGQLVSTYIVPPFSGTIVSIQKEIGEFVNEGEPVARLENSSTILIVGSIVSDRVLQAGLTANIDSRATFNNPTQFTLSGKVLTVFKHQAEKNEWEVVIKSTNTQAPNELPMNYQLNPDPAITRISIL